MGREILGDRCANVLVARIDEPFLGILYKDNLEQYGSSKRQNDGGFRLIICHALVCRCCWCLGIASRAQLLKESAWLIHLTGGKSPLAARDSSEVARA